jgi:ABC-type lipoprotein release transport system permease subunit
MKQALEQEIMVAHKRETRMQSIGMLLGIAIGVFVAMNVIDVVKSVEGIIETQELILHEHGEFNKMDAYILEQNAKDKEDILVMWNEINSMKTILLEIQSTIDSQHQSAE